LPATHAQRLRGVTATGRSRDYWEIATPDAGARRDAADRNVTATVISLRPQTCATTAVTEARVAFTPLVATVDRPARDRWGLGGDNAIA
jgi:hypothetical protein